ncbi:hypothetical protein N9544_00775 [Flavobacteriales bacterium]|nr:hypothetical protein [Flavobacteriales bacterium]
MKTIKTNTQGAKQLIKRTINKTNMKKLIPILIAVFAFNVSNAQIEKLSGPRIGITVVTPGSSADILNEGFQFGDDGERYGSTGAAFTTQFGWQWETRFGDEGIGVTGLVEWVALVGGMEKGLFLPSISSIVGARTDKGLEFGLGPNLSLSGIGLVFGLGYNFKLGNLNLPVNIAYIPGRKKKGNDFFEEYSYDIGSRISIMVGFNLIK